MSVIQASLRGGECNLLFFKKKWSNYKLLHC